MTARIAVIGAGMAGLVAARGLARRGAGPRVFDKSRGLGGRVATRRADDLAFDHGAPFAEAMPGAPLAAIRAEAEASGHAAPWPGEGAPGRFVGVPGMSALARPLAAGLSIDRSREVARIASDGDGWRLTFTDGAGAGGTFDWLVIAVPLPQAERLLATAGIHRPELRGVRMAPRWTLMAAPAEPDLALDAKVVADPPPPFERAILDSAKPGRARAPAIVAHADAAFSRERLEADRSTVAAALWPLLADRIGARRPPRVLAAHRWRYALTERPLGEAAVVDPSRRLALCGDWCLGDTVGAAVESGAAVARWVGDCLDQGKGRA